MRTLSFKTLLNRSARICGLDPARLEVKLAESFAEWIQSRVAKVGKRFPWPELCPIEERTLAPIWFVATVYQIGDIVAWDYADTGTWSYWQAQSAGAGTQPGAPGSETFWTTATDFDRLIEYEQADQTPIHDILGVWRQHPERVNIAQPIGYRLTARGILLPRDVPDKVFVRYRVTPPRLTTQKYSSTVLYTPDDVFFLPDTGHCYVPYQDAQGTSPVDAPDLFEVQPIPEVFADAVVRGIRADYLADDGQDDKSFAAERRADDWLDDSMSDITVHQHQTASYGVAG